MPALWSTVILLLGAAVVIYLACEFFVNGVEWVGRHFAIGDTATGTVLAAFGTALPESVVTFVAVVFGANAAARELGIGAAIGGPLALATIAYATVGIVLLVTRQRLPRTPAACREYRKLSRDQGWFLGVFAVKIVLGIVVFVGKPWFGFAFLAAYGLYVRQEMLGGDVAADACDLEPLKLQPHAETPAMAAALAQTLVALGVIFVASRVFVDQLAELGPVLGLRPQLLALLLSPVATELPETMNAVIWVRQGKYRLALANISGAMMIQATIPTAIGLFGTPWRLGGPALVAAGVTAVAIGVLFVAFRRGVIARWTLAAMAGLYLVFAAVLVAPHLSG